MRIELFAPMDTVPLSAIGPGQCFRVPGDSANAVKMMTAMKWPDQSDIRVSVSLVTGQTFDYPNDESVIAVAAKVVPL